MPYCDNRVLNMHSSAQSLATAATENPWRESPLPPSPGACFRCKVLGQPLGFAATVLQLAPVDTLPPPNLRHYVIHSADCACCLSFMGVAIDINPVWQRSSKTTAWIHNISNAKSGALRELRWQLVALSATHMAGKTDRQEESITRLVAC